MLVDTGSDRHRQWQHSRKRSCPAEVVLQFVDLLKLGFVLRHGLRDGVAAAQKVMIDRHGLESKLVLCMGKAVQKAGFGINCLSPLKLSHYGVVNWGSLGWLESDIRMRIA